MPASSKGEGGGKQMITASWSNQPAHLRYPGTVSVLPAINYWVCLLSSAPSRSRSSFPFCVLCSRIVLQGRIGRHTVSCQQRCHIVWNRTKWNRSQLGKSSLIPACSPLTVKLPLKDASFTNERQVQSHKWWWCPEQQSSCNYIGLRKQQTLLLN